jgi:hypothetical protein
MITPQPNLLPQVAREYLKNSPFEGDVTVMGAENLRPLKYPGLMPHRLKC